MDPRTRIRLTERTAVGEGEQGVSGEVLYCPKQQVRRFTCIPAGAESAKGFDDLVWLNFWELLFPRQRGTPPVPIPDCMAPTNLASELEFMVVFGTHLATFFHRRSPLGPCLSRHHHAG